MTDPTGWRHVRDNVCMLQNAHADRIEAEFRDNARFNAEHVDIKRFGEVRTFYSKDAGFHQRAILSGDETLEQVDEVLQHFVDKKSACWIEINPANFYSSDPASQGSKILPHLLQRGYVIANFRAVWVRDMPLAADEQDFRLDCRSVENSIVYAQSQLAAGFNNISEKSLTIEADSGSFSYVGYHEGRDVCWATMFCEGESAYLMNAHTHDDFLCRGFHGQMIRLRVRHAFEMGAHRVYTHTEFNGQSARNLQRNGFQLAYNCILIVREPVPFN